MANEIRTKPITKANFTISLAPGGTGLASGSARQSDLLTNSNNYPAALVFLKIKSGGSAPTAGSIYEVYLIRADETPTLADDGAGASDAAITIENAPLLGSIVVTATTAKNFYGVFDTAPLGPLGPKWGIAIKNVTGNAVDTTESNHGKEYIYYIPEVQ